MCTFIFLSLFLFHRAFDLTSKKDGYYMRVWHVCKCVSFAKACFEIDQFQSFRTNIFAQQRHIFFFVTEFEQQREVKENGGFLERVLWGIWLFRGWKNALQL